MDTNLHLSQSSGQQGIPALAASVKVKTPEEQLANDLAHSQLLAEQNEKSRSNLRTLCLGALPVVLLFFGLRADEGGTGLSTKFKEQFVLTALATSLVALLYCFVFGSSIKQNDKLTIQQLKQQIEELTKKIPKPVEPK